MPVRRPSATAATTPSQTKIPIAAEKAGPLGKRQAPAQQVTKERLLAELPLLGALSDAGVRETKVRKGALATAPLAPEFLRFAARAIELDSALAPEAKAALKALLGRPLPSSAFLGGEVSARELISVARRAARTAGIEPSKLKVELEGEAIPLSVVEHDLDATWQKHFAPAAPVRLAPLGRGVHFKPRIERTREFVVGATNRPLVSSLHPEDAERLGTLSDEALRKIHFTKPSVLERPDAESTGPGLLRFMARMVEIDGPLAAECARGLKHFFTQPISEGAWQQLDAPSRQMIPALIRAAQAAGLKPDQVKVYVNESDKPVALSKVEAFLASRPKPYVHEYSDENRLVYPHGEVGEGGAMPYNYGHVVMDSSMAYPVDSPPVRLPPSPGAPPRPPLSPAPPPYTSPARPPPVVLNPAPPRYVSPVPEQPFRPSTVSPWEIIRSGVASEFFEAKSGGFRGSWEDWLDRR